MEIKRLSVLKGKVLNDNIDEKLQLIVSEASRVSGFPVALVTLILRRTQHYKAFVGLPGDLAAYRSTDSCLSFCQYVVKTKKPLKIFDARQEPSLPQHLVEMYGIRSYYGYPIEIDNQVVGSLCVVDKKPNSISDDTHELLIGLAKEASSRMKQLASDQSGQYFSSMKICSPNQKKWDDIAFTWQEIQIALADLSPVVKAMAYKNTDSDGTQLHMAQGYLTEATKAYDDLKIALDQLNNQLKELKLQTK